MDSLLGDVTSGVQESWSEPREEGRGNGSKPQWAREEQTTDVTAAESDNRGGAGGTSCSASPVIHMENKISEQHSSAFAVGARRNTETASLALILRKTDSVDAVKAWRSRERFRPALKAWLFACSQGHLLCLLITAMLSFIQACMFILRILSTCK